MLAKPKIVIFDSATLGKVSRDYWSQEANSRDKAHSFISKLKHYGVFVAFTLHHISELLRYENENIVLERLKFLRSLPLIAWMRPYNRQWFPGSISDLITYELHSVVHSSSQNHCEIRNEVRSELWETGVGHEMFIEDDYLWANLRSEFKRHHENEKKVASVDRTDPGKIRDFKISEILNLPIRPKEKRKAYLYRFAQEMQKQLDCHGDKRLSCSSEIAIDFANNTLQNISNIEEQGGDIIKELLKTSGVPNEFVVPEMTLGDLGELGVYVKRLKGLASSLHPSVELTITDVPPDTFPSYVLERKLAFIQRKAERVSGSDMGDRHIAPLIFYANAIEVDKRTCEYLNQVRRNEPELALLMGDYFSSSDYSQIAISEL